MKKITVMITGLVMGAGAWGQKPPLLAGKEVGAMAVSDVAILQFPADGRIFYGTQRSRPAWDAEKGELLEIKDTKEIEALKEKNVPYVITCDQHGDAKPRCGEREEGIESYEAEPVALGEDRERAGGRGGGV